MLHQRHHFDIIEVLLSDSEWVNVIDLRLRLLSFHE